MKTSFASISAILFIGALYAQPVYLNENFDAGIPGTWTVSNNICPGHGTGYWTWEGTTNGWRGTGMGNSLDGTELVVIDSDIMGLYAWCDQTLTSPVFDPTASATLKIDFDHYYKRYSNDTGRVEVYDGASWIIVVTYSSTVGGWMAPDQPTIDITPYINANMQIRFRYQANWDWYWAVDNAKVYEPAVLPVEIISFTGRNEGNVNVLEWQTASETNNDYFIIEASPEGGEMQWEEIGVVNGAGNSNTTLNYSFTDYSPPFRSGTGWAYYRLKQIDYDGKYEYSQTITVSTESNLSNYLNVYPNPSFGNITIELQAMNTGIAEVIIVDMLGKEVFTEKVKQSTGTYRREIDLNGFAKGIYTLQLNTNEAIINKKVIMK